MHKNENRQKCKIELIKMKKGCVFSFVGTKDMPKQEANPKA